MSIVYGNQGRKECQEGGDQHREGIYSEFISNHSRLCSLGLEPGSSAC